MDSIKYEIGSNDEINYYVDIFEILCQYLPVQSQLSQDAALEQIVSILPKRTSRAPDSEVLYTVALDMAGQTPYKHPSMKKLSSIVVAMIETYDSKDCYVCQDSQMRDMNTNTVAG